MSELQAGREMDALVAEHVMGWEWVTVLKTTGVFNEGRSYLRTAHRARMLVEEHPELFEAGKNDNPCYGFETPAHSTDISAAWEVVEKTRERVSIEVEFSLFANEDETWDAEFGMEGVVQADTAPLAICRAALEAVGYKGEE